MGRGGSFHPRTGPLKTQVLVWGFLRHHLRDGAFYTCPLLTHIDAWGRERREHWVHSAQAAAPTGPARCDRRSPL
ncbi:hypothetical protein GCM10010446_26230 [Streptomyces enissocaesilis]|uniref:Uncharacterized protein n=1 Tax=Streptomyces enissocaesilis TaxID=332589 RepID=A0ABP6JQD7_9ACTN